MTALAAAVLLPSAGWVAGRVLAGRTPPPAAALVAAGAAMPPLSVAWAERTFFEQLLAWAVALVGWGGLLVGRDPQVLAAAALVGGTWSAVLALTRPRPAPPPSPSVVAAERTSPPPPPGVAAADESAGDDFAFHISVACPACGAAVSFPVYHRMAACEFCGSRHLVRSAQDTVEAVIPDTVTDADRVADAVVAHLRHARYLELYDRRVRPLVERSNAAADDELAPFLAGSPVSPVVAAAEAAVNAAADRYADRIRPTVEVLDWERFLAPYWHQAGTLYQAAFGRDREATKRMEFSVTALEDSLPASPVPLPAMGKLSYLRALRPLRGAPEESVPALAPERPAADLTARLEARRSRTADFGIRVIAVHSTFVPTVRALVWRPWHRARVAAAGATMTVLVDGGAGSVAAAPPPAELPTAARTADADTEVELRPCRCPECGAELAFAPDAASHLCPNCLRCLHRTAGRWSAEPYLRDGRPGDWFLPFWRFPFRLRTADGELVEDLPHLTDGIDGTFDQIGDAPARPEWLLVPAFRVRLSKNGIRFYRRLWLELALRPPSLRRRRFDLDAPAPNVVGATMPREEARIFAGIYLALAFTRRDLARAEIRGVRARFLEARVEGAPELAWVALPSGLVEPHRALVTVPLPPALEKLRGS